MSLTKETHQTALEALRRVKKLEGTTRVLISHLFNQRLTEEEFTKRMEKIERDKEALTLTLDPDSETSIWVVLHAHSEALDAIREDLSRVMSDKQKLDEDPFDAEIAAEGAFTRRPDKMTTPAVETSIEHLQRGMERVWEALMHQRELISGEKTKTNPITRLRRFHVHDLTTGELMEEGVSIGNFIVSKGVGGLPVEVYPDPGAFEILHGPRYGQRIEWLD